MSRMLAGFEENAQDIVETVREPLLILDAQQRVISANRSFYRTFSVNSQESEGQLLYELGNGQWNIPQLRELLERILPEKETIEDYQVEHTFRTIGHKIMLLNARQVYTQDQASKLILLAIDDVTARMEAERERETVISELRRALDEIRTLRGILPICASCKNIRDDKGYWVRVEEYVRNHSDAEFTHGLCPSCAKKLYPGLMDDEIDATG